MPRQSNYAKKIQIGIDGLQAELFRIDTEITNLHTKREMTSRQISDYRDLLDVPRPAKKKAPKKAKTGPVLQCPHCGEIASKNEWPESEKNNGMLRCPKCQAEIKGPD